MAFSFVTSTKAMLLVLNAKSSGNQGSRCQVAADVALRKLRRAKVARMRA